MNWGNISFIRSDEWAKESVSGPCASCSVCAPLLPQANGNGVLKRSPHFQKCLTYPREIWNMIFASVLYWWMLTNCVNLLILYISYNGIILAIALVRTLSAPVASQIFSFPFLRRMLCQVIKNKIIVSTDCFISICKNNLAMCLLHKILRNESLFSSKAYLMN